MVERPEITEVHRKALEALREAVADANGEFDGIDFEQARADFLESLTPNERMVFDAMEDAVEGTGDVDRRTAETVNFLRDLGAVGVPEPDPLQ